MHSSFVVRGRDSLRGGVVGEDCGNVGIGTTTPSAGRLQVEKSAEGQTILAVNSATGGSNYGIDAEAVGSGAALNIGGYFAAAGATTNRAIQIPSQFPTAGPANHAIYSASPAQSYFALNVGIGTTTPSAGRLQVEKSSEGQTILAVNSATSGWNYGIDAEATGAGAALNIGGYFAATGAAANRAILIPAEFPTAGAANYAIYSVSPAQSYFAGNVGIGTASPAAKLHVAGHATIDGNATVNGNIAAKFQDVAEWVDSVAPLEPGTLVVIDPTTTNRVLTAHRAYDARVAGAISAQPGVVLGEAGPGRALVAQSGRVRIKADARYGAIRPGDLLVSSPTRGHAMRSRPIDMGGHFVHRPGTIIGKALEALPQGRGEILVLLTLQ